MPAYLFVDVVIKPTIFLIALFCIGHTCVSALLHWYRAQQQAQRVVEEHPFEEFHRDLCQYANANYTEQEARGIYAAWHERVLLREEVKQ